MNESLATPWQGDWQQRLRAKLESLGFGDLEGFLSANPGIGYVQLAASLGDANVAAMQLYGQQIRTAIECGRLRDAAKDCLARFINEHCKRGWGNGRHFERRLASVYGAWTTAIATNSSSSEELREKMRMVFDELEKLAPESGWLPVGGNDELIERAFQISWPDSPMTTP